MRLIGVQGRGIFLISGALNANGKAYARYIGTTEEVTELVEARVVPDYNQPPDLSAETFTRLFTVKKG